METTKLEPVLESSKSLAQTVDAVNIESDLDKNIKIDKSLNKNTHLMNALTTISEEQFVKGITNTINYMAKLLPRHNMTLAQRGPWYDQKDRSSQIDIFSEEENSIFAGFGLTRREIIEAIVTSGTTRKEWKALNDPFMVFLSILIHYLYMNRENKKFAKIHKMEKELQRKNGKDFRFYQSIALMLTIKIYSIKLRVYFKHGNDAATMEYVINNKINNKSAIKHCKNMLELLMAISVAHFTNKAAKLLEQPGDTFIMRSYSNLQSRINSTLKTISRVYYKHVDAQKGHTISTFMQGEDGKDFMTIPTSISAMIELRIRFLQGALEKSKTADYKLLRDIAAQLKISGSLTNDIKIALDISIRKKKDLILEFYVAMFGYFLTIPDEKKKSGFKYSVEDILSVAFLSETKKMMNISNTANPLIKKSRDLVRDILIACMARYTSINRDLTKSQIRTVINFYLVMYSQNVLKRM